jgi:magnesium chelatase family protein
MGLALVHGRARVGVRAPAVKVEVHLAGGLPSMSIVGLPEAAVREAKDRVRAAICCAQFEFPARRITVNLAPADLPKDGGRFDLPIALGILAASGQVPLQALADHEFHGELGLTGELRPVDGILPAALAAARDGRRMIVPAGNGAEAALARGLDVRTARTLLEVCGALAGRRELPLAVAPEPVREPGPDLADVRGQVQARRALEVAAAGSHHLLLIGPPGCGKTLLATLLAGAVAASRANPRHWSRQRSRRSADAVCAWAQWRQRPFRSPHHSASAVALIGGGSGPRPGRGIAGAQRRAVPRRARRMAALGTRSACASRWNQAASSPSPAPAQLRVSGALPAGGGDEPMSVWICRRRPGGRCRCSAEAIARYRARLSGPLLDRIDLHVEVPRLPAAQLRPDAPPGESSAKVRDRVESARAIAAQRAGRPNAHMTQAETDACCRLSPADQALLERAIESLQLSARSMHRILRVARTIADLAGSADIATAHLTEAIGYRRLDRGQQLQAA